MVKRAWYLPDKHPETKKDRSNGDWSALLIIIWRDDGGIWRYDDMTNQSRWSFSYFGIRRDIMSVLSSNHFSSQQPNNYPTNRLLPFPIMPMMNSRTFQSSSGLNTITRPSPGGLEVTTHQDNRYVETNLVSFWWRLICFDLDPWHGLHRPPFDSRVQDSWDGWLSLGTGPLQPWRVGEASRTRANRSSLTILVENHQDGGD